MKPYPSPLDLRKVRPYPLAQRDSLSFIERMLVDPSSSPRPLGQEVQTALQACIQQIQSARQREAGVILMYGAHLIKNGAMLLVNWLIENGWITHLATNGAGTIHDWELAFLGR